MSRNNNLQSHMLITLTCIACLFSSCLKDKCEQTYRYKMFKPVYISAEELRAAVKTLPATPLLETGKIYYKSPYLFVNEINKGIHIIDNSNPSMPQNISFINIPGNIDIVVKGNILYADSYIDLVVLDITNPQNISEVSRVIDVFPNRIYEGGWVGDPAKGIVADWIESDTTIISECYGDPWGWGGMEGDIIFFGAQFDGGISSTGSSSNNSPGVGIAGSTAQFALYDEYLYCLTDATLELFDISDPVFPQQGSTVEMPWNIETIFPYNTYLFIGSTTGVQIYDNSNPSSPTFLSNFVHASSCDPVVVSGNYAYSTLRSGNACQGFTNQLDIIDISTISNP
ncbi:MAG: hypothetical protein H7X71_01155, partial [Chitinophagales bacterium]|nr:hypothetical protein [Chitinophagales bacterium]